MLHTANLSVRLLLCARIDVSTCACGHACKCQPLLTGTSALSDHIHPNPSIHNHHHHPHPPPFLPSLGLQLHIWVFLPLTCAGRRAARSKTASLHSSAHAHITAPLAGGFRMRIGEQELLSPLWLFCSFTVAETAMKHKVWKQYIVPRSSGVFQTAACCTY